MLIKMRENKGFTLVELMIVVAIIGILAAVAVPFYEKYIEKARITSLVYPAIHTANVDIASYYATSNSPSNTAANQKAFPASGSTFMLNDASTDCATGAYTSSGKTNAVVTWTIKPAAACPQLREFANQTITVRAVVSTTNPAIIIGWYISGQIASQLGLTGLQ